MKQSFQDSSTVAVAPTGPSPAAIKSADTGPSCRNGRTTSSTSMGNRNRSVSMAVPSNAPPSKKHRASDDELEQATPPCAPAPCASLSTNETDAAAAASAGGRGDKVSDGTDVPDVEEDNQNGDAQSSLLTSMPSFGRDMNGSDDDSDVSEEAFSNWLVEQKSAGMPACQMLDALGLGVSEGVAVDDDELWQVLLSMGIRLVKPSLTRPRGKLDTVNTLQDVASLLRSSKKIVVLAGAGISVSCGIPDFRSENGIYSRLSEYNLPNPQCMFDIEFFRSNPRPFFAFAKELFPKSNGFTFVPSRSHYFLKLLEEKGKLLRIYSQNIDMLEQAAGISHEHAVLCHGSFATATCLACKQVYPSKAIRGEVLNQRVPMCKSCNSPDGIVKPDIVFFGESLPRRFHDSIKSDEGEADLVLVMGSSLKVNPVRSIVGRFKKDTPMILINREPVGRPHKFDVELLGYSDEIVQELCRLLGWDIPEPDLALLGQSNLAPPAVTPSSTLAPLSFEFVHPSRYLFNGSKSTYCSSSDGGGSSSSSEDGTGGGQDMNSSADDMAVAIDAGDEERAPSTDDLVEGDQDDLMGSGNELLGSTSFDDN